MVQRLLAIGDVHGCFYELRELIEEKIRLTKDDRLVLLGDYIDRGPLIKEVIDYIIRLIREGFEIIPLLGNHEVMMMDSVKGEGAAGNWFINGGQDTLLAFRAGSYTDLENKYKEFFNSLEYFYREGGYLFVHAGFNDEIPDPLADRVQMVWSRQDAYFSEFFSDKIIVHGHTPVSLGTCRETAQVKSRVINIDTGCVYSNWEGLGYLTAIEIKTRVLFSVENRYRTLV